MPSKQTPEAVLDHDFLEMRHRVLDLASALDRIDRAAAGASVQDDPRLQKLCEAISLLIDGGPDRARRVQMAFSDAYDDGWQDA